MAGRNTMVLLWAALALSWGGDGVVGLRLLKEEMAEQVVVVENGTVEAVVLDCPFQMEEGEELTGIVIKWYFEDTFMPVYQWIPSMPDPPQATGEFKGRVDTEYRVEEVPGPAHIHRALRLLQPTTDFSGLYYCVVDSFAGDKVHTRWLVVYSKPERVEAWTKEMEVEGEGGVKEKGVMVMCVVERMYPQPIFSITHTLSDGGESREVTQVDVVTSFGDGVYNVRAEGWISDQELAGLTNICCNATVPGTQLAFANYTQYQPVMNVKEAAVIGGAGRNYPATAALMSLCLLLVLRWL